MLPLKLAIAAFVAAAIFGVISIVPGPDHDAGARVEPPWELPPRPGTPEHIAAAKALAQHLRRRPDNGLQYRARALEWNAWWDKRPIGNLHRQSLRDLLVGNWFVYEPGDRRTDRWHYLYFDEDGVMWACTTNGEGGYGLHRFRHEWAQDLGGASTFVIQPLATSDETWLARIRRGEVEWVGRPITYDGATGALAIHYTGRDGRWRQHRGHVQESFNPAFGILCPGIPRPSGVPLFSEPAAAPPRTYAEFMELEVPEIIRHVRTLFPQDPDNPVTAGDYLSWYPPPDR
ncbi:MAG: hypothetical protein OXI46_11290 [Gemmatimonadota bacterium]|nr:hypothetical protein [Gemmatimonadota bacterium]